MYTPKNRQIFADELHSYDWETNFFSCLDTNVLYENFSTKISDAFERSFPLVRVSRKNFKDKKWITPALKKSSETKCQLYKIWLKTKIKSDQDKYKNYVKLYSKILKKAEFNYYTTTFNSKLNSSKNIWKEINSLCSASSNRKSSQSTIVKLIVNGNTISDATEMANEFNNYFCNVGKNLAKNLPVTNLNNQFLDFLPPSISNSFVCDTVTEMEVYNSIIKFAAKRTAGPDLISAKLLLDGVAMVVPILCHLFNVSLQAGVFPSDLKIAKVIPIFKKGAHSELGNYRPISLLKIVSKIFEHIVAERLNSFLKKYNVLYEYQFGFRAKHSTTLALLNAVDDIHDKLNNKNYVAGIFFDLSKAFDSIDHEILFKKLHHYGIRGKMYEWFKSYLSDRLQYTCVNGCNSTLLNNNYGVPQGSVLGPILFLIYINDIGSVHDLIYKPKLFADDTNLFVFSPTLQDLKCQCQDSINKVAKWLSANKLTLNYDKTCYMIFDCFPHTSGAVDLELYVNIVKILKTSSSKYLGVTIDSSLSWKLHINSLCMQLRKFVGIFYKLSFKLPPATLKLLYFALVYPHILYAIEIYANTYLTYMHDLIILNNRLLRILQHKSRDTHTIELYSAYNTLPITKLFQQQILLHAYKLRYLPETLPSVFQNKITTNSALHSHNTRSKSDFHRTQFTSAEGSKTSYSLCTMLWNRLPNELKLPTSSLKNFHCKIKLFLLSNDM